MDERSKHIDHPAIEEITERDLELLEQLFREDLPDCPIDLELYEQLAEEDEDIRLAFEPMLATCLRYTEDVADLEKMALEKPGVFDEDRAKVDEIRSRTHDAVIADINIFSRTLQAKGLSIDWLKWQSENRPAYGNFAITLTLNRFKDIIQSYRDLIVEKVAKKIGSGEMDLSTLKQDATQAELEVIKYVEILIEILKEEDEKEDATVVPPETIPEMDALKEIETKLRRSSTEILSAFHRIYSKRYED